MATIEHKIQVRFINLVTTYPLLYSSFNCKVTKVKRPYNEWYNISTDIAKAVRYAYCEINCEKKKIEFIMYRTDHRKLDK